MNLRIIHHLNSCSRECFQVYICLVSRFDKMRDIVLLFVLLVWIFKMAIPTTVIKTRFVRGIISLHFPLAISNFPVYNKLHCMHRCAQKQKCHFCRIAGYSCALYSSDPNWPATTLLRKDTGEIYVKGIVCICEFLLFHVTTSEQPTNGFDVNRYEHTTRFAMVAHRFVLYLQCSLPSSCKLKVPHSVGPHISSLSISGLILGCQWETLLQSNAVSLWLGTNLKSAMYLIMGYRVTSHYQDVYAIFCTRLFYSIFKIFMYKWHSFMC